MRKAIQRCSASLPRTFASLSSSRSSDLQCIIRQFAQQNGARSTQVLVRQIHQSSLRHQEAAAARAPPQTDIEDNGAITRFDELGSKNILHPNVVRALTQDMRLETMTEVQSRTINEALRGDDTIAQAKTGTGKTLAFLIPILQRIISVDPRLAERSGDRRGPRTTADDIRAIIISPTRELAEQIAMEAKRLVRHTGIIVQTAVGGTHKRAGLMAIQREGCHILVGTPGRMKDILSDPYTRVQAPDLSAFVLDEADRLLDQGFWPEIQEIQRYLPTPQEKDRQTMMFSATVPREVVDLVRSTLKPGFQFVQCVQEGEDPTHPNVTQKVVTVSGLENSLPALVELCQKCVDASQQPEGKPFKALVYFNSTAEVTFARSALQNLVKPGQVDAFGPRGSQHPWAPARILEIHSRLSQAQRTAASDAFRRAESAILLSSDVTARGMDFPNVSHVIQVGLPTSREQYIHRVGRTARAGKEGEAWLLLNQMEAEEARSKLRNLPVNKDTSLETARLDLTKEAQVPVAAGQLLSMYQNAMRKVPVSEKSAVYRAQIGVYGWFGNKDLLVERMNNLARFGWGMAQPPMIPPGLASKLRLDRVPGLNIGFDPEQERPRSPMGGGRGFAGRDDRFGGERRGYQGRDNTFGGGRGAFGGMGDRSGGRDDRSGGGRGGYGGDRGGYGGGRYSAGSRPPPRQPRDDPFGL